MAIRNLGPDATVSDQRAYADGWRKGYHRIGLKVCPPWHKTEQTFWYDGFEDGFNTRREESLRKSGN